jgi:hypothetical protein
LVSQMDKMIGKVINIPRKLLSVAKNGVMRGWTVPSTTFQSKVGHGLRPRPVLVPQTAARSTLLGAIQAIHEKVERAAIM